MKYSRLALITALVLFCPMLCFPQLALRPSPKAGFETRIRTFVNGMQIVDTHEHLMEEKRVHKESIDFMWLLFHYADDDIKSAGLAKAEFAELLSSKYSIHEKWKIVKPFWEASSNTAYNRNVLLTLERLYGIPDLNDSTYELLSEKLKNSYNGKWYDFVLKEKSNIQYVIQDVDDERSGEPYFRYVEKFDQFIRIHSKAEVLALAKKANANVTSLDDYIALLAKSFQDARARGMIGVKSALAYHRILKYENVPKPIADSVFSKLMASSADKVFSFEQVKPFQDYVMHQIIQLVRKNDIHSSFTRDCNRVTAILSTTLIRNIWPICFFNTGT